QPVRPDRASGEGDCAEQADPEAEADTAPPTASLSVSVMVPNDRTTGTLPVAVLLLAFLPLRGQPACPAAPCHTSPYSSCWRVHSPRVARNSPQLSYQVTMIRPFPTTVPVNTDLYFVRLAEGFMPPRSGESACCRMMAGV